MFVQEFVRIEVPLTTVVGAFEQAVLPRFGDLVRDAWTQSEWSQSLPPTPPAPVPIAVGQRRDRVDGVAYAVSWPAIGPDCPDIDADIEIAAVTPTESHLEFAGQSTYPLVEPWSADAIRANRRCRAAVDRLLRSIAEVIESSVTIDQ